MKIRTIDKILISVAALSGIAAALMQGGIIPDTVKVLVALISVGSLSAEAAWQVFGKPASNAKQADQLIQLSLDTLCKDFSENKKHEFRSNVMMPRGIFVKKLYIKYYSSNMRDAKDRSIVIEKWQGCAGQAWGANQPLAADLSLQSEKGMPRWALTPEIEEMTKELKVIVSVPLRHPEKTSKVVGVLNVDSKEKDATYLLDDPYLDKIKATALIITRMLDILEQI